MPRTVVWSLLTILTACSNTKPSDKPTKSSDAGAAHEVLATPEMCPTLPSTCATTTPPSFQNDIMPIISERCASCHTGIDGGPWALDSWENVAEWADIISVDLAVCSMPPADAGVSFPEREREKFWTWAHCQVPNN